MTTLLLRLAAFALGLGAALPHAHAVTLLPATAITTAVTGVTGPVYQFRRGSPRNLSCQANFAWGSGGTSAKAWVQTSLDGGATWTDNGFFTFGTALLRAGLNLSSTNVAGAAGAQVTLTDGTASASQDGIIGSLVRVKFTTTGTYVATTLQVDCISDNLTPAPAGVHE
jgi:hypothetical protein